VIGGELREPRAQLVAVDDLVRDRVLERQAADLRDLAGDRARPRQQRRHRVDRVVGARGIGAHDRGEQRDDEQRSPHHP
jgi:hypothetical protein